MNYTLWNIKVKSSWFDEGGKFKQMKADGFNLYLSLFKFRLHNQEYEHYFITSIKLLRIETGYSKNRTFELLKLLQKLRIIKIKNVTRWDRFLNEDGTIPDNHLLEIVAADLPNLNKIEKGTNQSYEEPKTPDDFYISLEFELLNLYLDRGLNYKSYPLACLIKKLQNGNIEKKSYMSVEKMARNLGYGKDYLNKLIHEMNRAYVLYSRYRKNGKKGHYFEHFLMKSTKEEEKFLEAFKDEIESNIKKWEKAKESKS